MNFQNRVESPCVGNCCLDQDDVCLGCYRSLDEIKSWGLVGDGVRTAILSNAEERAARKKRPDLQCFHP